MMKQNNRYVSALGLALLAFLALWTGFYQGGPVLAQEDTPRPTPTNVGESPPVPDPTDTPVPPTAVPAPATSAPPSDPPRQEPAAPRQETVGPAPVSGQATTVPNTGLLSPGVWGAAVSAGILLGVIFGARYLRRERKER